MYRIKHGDYQVGSVIEYSPHGGGTRRVRVTDVEDDVKNGQPGFTGELLGVAPGEFPAGVWGYTYQVTRVVTL